MFSSGDLFGLYSRSMRVPIQDEILVYPRIFPVERLEIPSLQPAGDFRTVRRVVQDPTRPTGVRDYRFGDSPRHIHWKASARARGLRVKIFESTTNFKAALFLCVESFRTSEALAEEDFELAVSTAASVAHHVVSRGSPVGLFANSRAADSGHAVSLAPAGRRGWIFSGQRGLWLGLVGMVVCLVITLGLLLGVLLRPDLLSLMIELLKAAWTFVSELAVRVFSFLFSLFPVPESKGIRLTPPQISPMDRDPSFIVKLFRIPEAVRRVGEIAVGCLWILLVLIALWRVSSSILAWLTRKVMSLDGVEVEPLSGAFLEDLRALARFVTRQVARVWRWLRRITGWKEGAAAARSEDPAAREVYRKVLAGLPGRAAPGSGPKPRGSIWGCLRRHSRMRGGTWPISRTSTQGCATVRCRLHPRPWRRCRQAGTGSRGAGN